MLRLSRRGVLAAALGLLTANLVQAEANPKYWVYIGTGGGGKAKGIYRCEFAPANGALTNLELVAEVNNPSFLALHPTNKFLYSIGKIEKSDGVHAFSLDAKTGKLAKLNDFNLGNPGPCHLNVDKSGQCVVVANYGGGSCTALKVLPDGRVGDKQDFHQHKGSSINPARQKEPHTHSANFSADGKHVVLADLGLDKLIVYKVDAAAGTIAPHSEFKCPPGSGPRHFAWHPNGKWAYTNGEMGFTVTAMTWDNDKGVFAAINTVPTLPADTADDIKKKNSTAEILVHPSGKWVFCSNRGHDSLAVFRVNDESGGLAPAGHITGDIKTPRNFNLSPDGRWILVANLDGDSVTVFDFDVKTGAAKPTATKLAVGKPMCLKFVAKE